MLPQHVKKSEVFAGNICVLLEISLMRPLRLNGETEAADHQTSSFRFCIRASTANHEGPAGQSPLDVTLPVTHVMLQVIHRHIASV